MAEARFTLHVGETRHAQASATRRSASPLRFRRTPVAYLVNQYPAGSHTFIRREIRALEALGIPILRQAVRAQPALKDPEDLAELSRTEHLLGDHADLARGLLDAARNPRASLRASFDALRLMRRSDRSPAHHLAYLIEAFELARRLKRAGAAHLHAHFGTNSAEVAMLAAPMAGIGFSFTVHGQEEFDKPTFLALPRKIAQASFVATVSDYGRAQLLRWCAPADQEKIHVIRCGLDFDAEPAALAPVDWSGRRTFLNVGRFCREKAQGVFVEAIAALRARGRNVDAVLVGDGEGRAELEAQIAGLGLAGVVRLTGWLDGGRVRAEMRAARALVVSSFAENLPVVIMEAMAEGRPVVSTWIAGIPEIVVDRATGWLAPPASVEALAEAMDACLQAGQEEMDAMAERCRLWVRHRHDVHVEAARLAALFPAG